MQCRVAEKDMNDLRDKLVNANRSLTSATGNISNQETLICQLRGKSRDARINWTLRITLLTSCRSCRRSKGPRGEDATSTK